MNDNGTGMKGSLEVSLVSLGQEYSFVNEDSTLKVAALIDSADHLHITPSDGLHWEHRWSDMPRLGRIMATGPRSSTDYAGGQVGMERLMKMFPNRSNRVLGTSPSALENVAAENVAAVPRMRTIKGVFTFFDSGGGSTVVFATIKLIPRN